MIRFYFVLPQNGSQTPEIHSVAGKEAEMTELLPQNRAQGSESHSVAMLAVPPATLARNLASTGAAPGTVTFHPGPVP